MHGVAGQGLHGGEKVVVVVGGGAGVDAMDEVGEAGLGPVVVMAVVVVTVVMTAAVAAVEEEEDMAS